MELLEGKQLAAASLFFLREDDFAFASMPRRSKTNKKAARVDHRDAEFSSKRFFFVFRICNFEMIAAAVLLSSHREKKGHQRFFS